MCPQNTQIYSETPDEEYPKNQQKVILTEAWSLKGFNYSEL